MGHRRRMKKLDEQQKRLEVERLKREEADRKAQEKADKRAKAAEAAEKRKAEWESLSPEEQAKRKKTAKTVFGVIGGLIVLFILIGILGGGGEDGQAGDGTSGSPSASATPQSSQGAEKAKEAEASKAKAEEQRKASEDAAKAKAKKEEAIKNGDATSTGLTSVMAAQACNQQAETAAAEEGLKWKGHTITGMVQKKVIGDKDDVMWVVFDGELKNAAGGEVPGRVSCQVTGTQDNPEISDITVNPRQ